MPSSVRTLKNTSSSRTTGRPLPRPCGRARQVENVPAARPPLRLHSIPPAVSSASIIIVTIGCSTLNGNSVMDELLRNGILLFNNCEFFQCHEVLEETWTKEVGPRRLFLQALIHLAVGFYHCERANPPGASSQLKKG